MPSRLQAWGEAFRGGPGSGFFVGLEDLCVYEGYPAGRWDACHVSRLGADIMMTDGMAFWCFFFLASSFTVLAMVISRVQAGGQRRSVQTEAPINWIYRPVVVVRLLSVGPWTTGAVHERGSRAYLMPPRKERRQARSRPCHRHNHHLLPPKPLLFPTHRRLNNIIITSYAQSSPSNRPRPSKNQTLCQHRSTPL